ncbi:hypothetical protein ACFVAE_11435 [Microbacterium sp. NPDC057659]|uniref:HAAS signaling domain-containing protein n=1 Tax=Microbacterium sp. NPDC057659 TaxID=3346198 RepID=UPI003671015E
MTTEEKYLRDVERMLRGIDPDHRQTVLDDLRGHFADAADLGRPVDEVVVGLGAPAEIAERAREEFGADDSAAERAWWVLQGATALSALVLGVLVAYILPLYSVAQADSNGATVTGTRTLAGMGDPWAPLAAFVPGVLTLIPLLVPRRARTTAAVTTGVVLTLAALIAGFTIGMFFVPTCMLAWAAAVVWTRLRGPGFGRGWRIAGMVLALVPVAVLVAFVMLGSLLYRLGPLLWGGLAIAVVLALLIARGVGAAGWALAALGLVVLPEGLVLAAPLGAFNLMGAWWLTIGLAHAVATPARGRG